MAHSLHSSSFFQCPLPPSLLRPSVTHSIPFLFSTQKGDELPLQTLLRLNPQDWHRETNLTEDIPVRLRARRTRQDPRTGRLLLSTVTVLINSRCISSANAQKVSRSYDEHQHQCLVCSVPCDRCCVAFSLPLSDDCSHETLCTRCVFNVDGKNSCPNDYSLSR